MARRTLTLLGAVAALLLLAAIGGAALGAVASQPAVSSANVDAYVKSSATRNLSNGAAVKTTIVSVTLPAGSWIITSSATVVTLGEGSVVRCGVFAGTRQLQGSARLAATAVDEMTAVGAVKKSASFTASLKCWQDGAVAGAPNYVDPGAALWAHKSSSLSL